MKKKKKVLSAYLHFHYKSKPTYQISHKSIFNPTKNILYFFKIIKWIVSTKKKKPSELQRERRTVLWLRLNLLLLTTRMSLCWCSHGSSSAFSKSKVTNNTRISETQIKKEKKMTPQEMEMTKRFEREREMFTPSSWLVPLL